jgi:small basic protein
LKKEITQRPIDHYFTQYSEKYSTDKNRITQGICAWLAYFGLLGLSWSVPFPQLSFLGQYNSYFNWASFVIAFSIYYYSKLSPLLSYVMLFLTLVFTYIITVLERQFSNPLFMSAVFFLILLIAYLVHYLSEKKTGKNSMLKTELFFVLIGPVWTVHFVLKKWSVKY